RPQREPHAHGPKRRRRHPRDLIRWSPAFRLSSTRLPEDSLKAGLQRGGLLDIVARVSQDGFVTITLTDRPATRMTSDAPALRLRGLTKTYPGVDGGLSILRGVNLDL